jgi:phosphate-selective porin OprO/OprP
MLLGLALSAFIANAVAAQPNERVAPPDTASSTPGREAAADPSPASKALAPATEKNYPTVKFTGAVQVDAGWFSQSPQVRAVVGDATNGVDIRRLRLGMYGAVTDNVDYRLQVDAGQIGRPTIVDAYLDVKDLPLVGTARAGLYKQFFGLEELTSFRFNPFMERASTFLLQPFRRIGVGFYNASADEQFTWAAALIASQNMDQYGGDLADGGAGMVSRVTWNPIYSMDDSYIMGPQLLHLGLDYHLNGPPNGRMRIGATGASAPEFGLFAGTTGTTSFTAPPNTPSFVDTGVIAARLYNLWGVEMAGILGPFSVQAEANFAEVTRFRPGELYFWGGYVFTTVFLTGDHRVYNRQQAIFDRVIPRRNFGTHAGESLFGGAWEVGYRLSYLDATDQNVDGGRLLDHTLAVNWYLNPYVKLSFNYIHSQLWRGVAQGAPADTFAVRAQLDF